MLDEFHERSVHADLGIALVRQAWRARGDLRVLVMSATLDASAVAAYLDGCAVVEVPGRTFPLDVEYAHAIAPGARCHEKDPWSTHRQVEGARRWTPH